MSMKMFLVCVSTASLLILNPGGAHADGFRNPPSGAAGLGRAGVNLTHSEDASSLFYNPANILMSESTSVQAGLALARLKTDFKSGLGTESMRDSWQALPYAFAIHPLEEEVSIGIGITFPHGQSVEWERQGIFRYAAPYFAEMRLANIGPALAYRAHERLLLGIGLDFFDSSLEIKQAYNWSQVVPGSPDGDARLKGDGQTLGANAGMTVLLPLDHRLAFRYRTRMTMDYDGSARISNMPEPLTGIFQSRSDFSTKLRFPEQYAIGYGLPLGDRVRLEVAVERLLWSSMKRQHIDIGPANTMLLGPASVVEYNWKDTWSYGFGADWMLSKEWMLRAGYQFLETPVPDETLSPSLPDADRHIVALGIGYQNGAHAIDLAWNLSIYDDRDVAKVQSQVFKGKYELDSDLLGLSYSYTF